MFEDPEYFALAEDPFHPFELTASATGTRNSHAFFITIIVRSRRSAKKDIHDTPPLTFLEQYSNLV